MKRASSGFSICLLGFAVSSVTALEAHADIETSASHVKVSAVAGNVDPVGQQIVTVTLAVEKGYFIFANPTTEIFAAASVKIPIESQGKPVACKVRYPSALMIKDKDIGDYGTYEGTVDIIVTVQRVQGDDAPLAVSAFFLAFNPQIPICLMPSTVKLTLK